jgi:hypothetical protein
MTIDSSLESLRQSYRPQQVRVLFVGESPPAGGTFFYRANSNLRVLRVSVVELHLPLGGS